MYDYYKKRDYCWCLAFIVTHAPWYNLRGSNFSLVFVVGTVLYYMLFNNFLKRHKIGHFPVTPFLSLRLQATVTSLLYSLQKGPRPPRLHHSTPLSLLSRCEASRTLWPHTQSYHTKIFPRFKIEENIITLISDEIIIAQTNEKYDWLCHKM